MNLNKNYYNTASNLSSAWRVFAIAVFGVILVAVDSIKFSNILYYLLMTFFVLDILHYFIALLFVQKWNNSLEELRMSEEDAIMKMYKLREFATICIYVRMIMVITILVLLFI